MRILAPPAHTSRMERPAVYQTVEDPAFAIAMENGLPAGAGSAGVGAGATIFDGTHSCCSAHMRSVVLHGSSYPGKVHGPRPSPTLPLAASLRQLSTGVAAGGGGSGSSSSGGGGSGGGSIAGGDGAGSNAWVRLSTPGSDLKGDATSLSKIATLHSTMVGCHDDGNIQAQHGAVDDGGAGGGSGGRAGGDGSDTDGHVLDGVLDVKQRLLHSVQTVQSSLIIDARELPGVLDRARRLKRLVVLGIASHGQCRSFWGPMFRRKVGQGCPDWNPRVEYALVSSEQFNASDVARTLPREMQHVDAVAFASFAAGANPRHFHAQRMNTKDVLATILNRSDAEVATGALPNAEPNGMQTTISIHPSALCVRMLSKLAAPPGKYEVLLRLHAVGGGVDAANACPGANFACARVKDNDDVESAAQPETFLDGCELRPEQLRSLAWMMQQEKTATTAVGEVIETLDTSSLSAPADQVKVECRLRPEYLLCGGILADNPGYGKTVVSLALASTCLGGATEQPGNTLFSKMKLALKAGALKGKDKLTHSPATLILVPAHLLEQWAHEVSKFIDQDKLHLEGRRFVKITSYTWQTVTVSDFKTAWLVLAPLQMFGWKQYTKQRATPLQLEKVRWARVIVDEAHEIDTNTVIGQAVAKLTATRRWGLTATPTVYSRNGVRQLGLSVGVDLGTGP